MPYIIWCDTIKGNTHWNQRVWHNPGMLWSPSVTNYLVSSIGVLWWCLIWNDNWRVLAVFWFVAVLCCGCVQIDEFWQSSYWWVLVVVLCKDVVFFCGPDWWDLAVWWCVVVWRVTGGGCGVVLVLVPVQSVFPFVCLVTIKIRMRNSFLPLFVWWQ